MCHFCLGAWRASERVSALALCQDDRQSSGRGCCVGLCGRAAPQWAHEGGSAGKHTCLNPPSVRVLCYDRRVVARPDESQVLNPKCQEDGDVGKGILWTPSSAVCPKRDLATYLFFGSRPQSNRSAHIWWVPAMAIHRMLSLWTSESL